MTGDDSARRAELLAKLVDYSRAHGLADMSLRPLAAAVGSSPRVLLYFFTSKDQLVREVVAHSRREQVSLVQAELIDPATEDSVGESAVDRLWQWLTDPDNAHVERLFFESYALSLRAEPGAWEGYGAASVAEWLPQLRPVAERLMPGADPEVAATLLLATLRGLLLDRLATGDSRRTDMAIEMFLHGLDGTALTAD
ncbi:MAG: TetR/AcrR family transcriptional regulator [Hamadaea sp.]|uniref:TetR/AcrR family transcriptional regulator n=1 Tax=Hamadaea sp. TaxID=2024425 RepID=UPI00185DC244|nr:TetR/AcrR family transcriptional regulator [Hamadaea sp.]NUT22446.1 TetR/AcrR family transcriptional regulator [Hamadaea sp.]